MIPFAAFVSEVSAADLLQQARWREGLYCPRCQSETVIRYGSYGAFQRYLCKDCDRMFNDKTGMIFACAKIALTEWFFAIYAFLRFNVSIRQLELDVSYRALHRRVERFCETLDAPDLSLSDPVEIDEVYVTAGMKARERDRRSRSRGLSTRGRGSYEGDKPPVFVLIDRGTGERYVVPAKSADGSTVRLFLANHEEKSLTVYTDGFRAYDPLDDDERFDREFVVHGNGEYVDGVVHVNTCESHGSLLRPWLSPHRGISKDRLTPYLRAFQLRRQLVRKSEREALKYAIEKVL